MGGIKYSVYFNEQDDEVVDYPEVELGKVCALQTVTGYCLEPQALTHLHPHHHLTQVELLKLSKTNQLPQC